MHPGHPKVSNTPPAGALVVLALLIGCTGGEQGIGAEVAEHVAQTSGAWRLLLAFGLGFLLSLLGSLPMTGPLALLVLDRVVSGQRRSALWMAVSGALVEGVVAAAIAALLPLVLAHSTSIVRISRLSGAVVIFVVGLLLVLRPQTVSELETTHKQQSLLAGFLATSLNPTLIATWTIAVTALHGNGLLDGGLQEGPLFGLGVALGVFAWFGALLLLVRLGPRARLNRYRAGLGRGVGVVLLLIGALTLLHSLQSSEREPPAEPTLELRRLDEGSTDSAQASVCTMAR